MPSSPLSSAQVARAAVAARLQGLMKDAGLSGHELAARCGWHKSKSSRIARGKTPPSDADIRAWCAACGADDHAADIIAASRNAESMYVEWRQIHRDGMRRIHEQTTPLYQRTRSFCVYASNVMPGMLETAGYTTGLLKAITAAFGPEERFAHHLGSYLSVFSADNFLALDDWQMWLRDGDTGFGIMPVRDNTELRIAFGFESAPLAHDLRDGTALRQLVVDKLASLRWKGTRLAEAARKAPDFYCDAMAQIRMDQWSRGRVTLLGDAGYCPSPLSGQGTSLALVGAHVLADCLAQAPGDHQSAYARYEQRMRPFVAFNQALATENPGGPASEESVAHAKNALSLDS
ncbi:XRE family transcriptional regulator [Streptomyces sp. ISL-86]|uniref:XRE family transcriptional regulator n=1 Tax=Streptomyces sp. ISL-86 TaxID=2819187 RepID=UPI002034D9E7|nr:XRE family transcriptional regulator [Streptomyces sp. ISL-86]